MKPFVEHVAAIANTASRTQRCSECDTLLVSYPSRIFWPGQFVYSDGTLFTETPITGHIPCRPWTPKL